MAKYRCSPLLQNRQQLPLISNYSTASTTTLSTMKIFGKRKKTAKVDESKASAVDAASPASSHQDEKKVFASDAVVEELLKKDPSTWNAKEKRMVKRYQKRNTGAVDDNQDTCGTNDETTPSKNTVTITDDNSKEQENSDSAAKDEAGHDTEEESEEQPTKEPTKDGTTSLQLESILEASVFEALNSKQRRKLTRTLAKEGEKAVNAVIEEANEMVKGVSTDKEKVQDQEAAAEVVVEHETSDNSDNTDEMEHVKNLLQGLNSKQKRKLSRRLEREGSSCLAEIKAEAESLLQGASEAEQSTATGGKEANDDKSKTDGSTPNSDSKKRKRRRGPTDLSGLTPEERLRRDEQRKMQKEAAERRANGEDTSTGFRHPLNSERRRANKRKPKWAPKRAFANPDKIEHNASGFHVRKLKKSEAQE